MRQRRLFLSLLFPAIFGFVKMPGLLAQAVCSISINQSQVINPGSSKLLGISFDGRSSIDFDAGPGVDPVGYFDPITGLVLPGVQAAWSRVPINGVRYPGNLVVFNWNWSYTIGPMANRIAQPMGPNGSNSQVLKFGFDEFMDTVYSRGLPYSEVQIMVNIYPSVGQSNAAILAADWVEYCNAIVGTNPRNGTNWGALRDAYGHHDPYGVRIWNIGNEPWSSSELGNDVAGANAYIALAIPIIDSMLAADPTILITVPAVGAANSPWNSTLLASQPLMSRIWGFSPHAFYDENLSTSNPSVSQVNTLLTGLAAAVNAVGKKVVLGDHAHFAPNADPDKAMRWEGALANANLLTAVSQIVNIERANFWIYGNVKATWHPIRQNANGTYTFMAAAQLYEQFDAIFYDQSLATSVANASNGNPVPNVRATTFQTANSSNANVVVVNIDLAVDNEVVPPTMTGLILSSAKLISAPSINNDTFTMTSVMPLGNGNYSLPHASVLILEFQSPLLAVEYAEPMRAYPIDEGIAIEWTTVSEYNTSYFEVERSTDGFDFEGIKKVEARGGIGNVTTHYAAIDQNPPNGIIYYRIREVDDFGGYQFSKIMSVTFQNQRVALFPNPVIDQLTVQLAPNHDRDILFRVVSPSGQILLEENIATSAKATIDLAHIPSGMCFYQLWDGKDWLDGRILKR